MARLQDFQSVTPAGSDNLLIVQSQGQGLSTLNAVGQKVANDTTMSSLNTTSKNLVGAINEVKEKASIHDGGHASDLSTTGLSTGTYLYKYDSTTNGIPKANTEGDCYITINNAQAWGCELAVSNSGLYWRNKQNQVWGNWEDIIGKLTVNYAISTSPLNPNDTFQIPSTIMDNKSFVLVGFRRFESYATYTVSISAIKGAVLKTQAPIAQVDGSRYWRSKISNTGLITLLSSADGVAPYIEVYGFL